MSENTYYINKGVNRSIEFRGIKAQYILYTGIGLVILLLLFAIGYLLGLNTWLLLSIVIPASAALIIVAGRLSKKYGENGLSKNIAYHQLPTCIRVKNLKTFFLSGK